MNNLDFLRKNPIAHRGLWDEKKGIPENSIPAFERAIEKNYPIELDVHLLKDGNLVVFHDDNLNRMTGINKQIKYYTLDEIKKIRLKNTDYRIPVFSDVLKLVNGRVPILVEIKNDRKIGETENKIVELLMNYNGKYAIQSFNINTIIWFKKKYPEIPRGQLLSNFMNDNMPLIKKFLIKNMYLNFLSKPNFISCSIKVFPNNRVKKYRNKGNLVLGWTIRDNKDLIKAKNNCDNFIGENFNDLDLKLF